MSKPRGTTGTPMHIEPSPSTRRRRRRATTAPARLGKPRPGDTPAYSDTEARRVIAGGKARNTRRNRKRRQARKP